MKFSLLRFMIAVIPSAAALTFVRALGHSVLTGLLVSAFIGIPLSIIALIGTKKDAMDLLKMGLAILIIMFVIVMIEVLVTLFGRGH